MTEEPLNVMKNKRRAPRYRVKVKTAATMKLFGSIHAVKCQTENLSFSGMLLSSKERLDELNRSSILEIWLHINPEQSVYCIASFVHRTPENRIGVRITEIAEEDRNLYLDYISQFGEELK